MAFKNDYLQHSSNKEKTLNGRRKALGIDNFLCIDNFQYLGQYKIEVAILFIT